MKPWRQKLLDKGICPICEKRTLAPDRAACAECLKTLSEANRRWRKKNKVKHNAYMRAYMQRRRASKPTPVEGASPSPMGTRDALLARLEELRGQG